MMASKTSLVDFFKQVKVETRKVVWPSKREAIISTVMVLVLVTLASIFFLVVDQIFSFGVSQGTFYLTNMFR